MTRMQIQITEAERQRLRDLAIARREPIARIVREFIDEGLRRSRQPDRDELVRRFLAGAGTGHSGHSDISRRHDDYLEEIYDS